MQLATKSARSWQQLESAGVISNSGSPEIVSGDILRALDRPRSGMGREQRRLILARISIAHSLEHSERAGRGCDSSESAAQRLREALRTRTPSFPATSFSVVHAKVKCAFGAISLLGALRSSDVTI